MEQLSNSSGACPDLNHYELVARILANELSSFSLTSEPLDVAETIETLSDEMETMPQIISDCRLAVEAFSELDRTLDRMYSLADRAVESGDSQPALLSGLDEEFRGYSHIIARLAGANDFDGPSLSLASKNEAIVSRQILACLGVARQTFLKRLNEQRRRINDAMDEALEMLGRILSEVEEISHETREGLTELVDRLNTMSREIGLGANSEKPLWLN